ncbi:RAMP superfamily CRISPR-associated protein [Roseateles sp. GG27B]
MQTDLVLLSDTDFSHFARHAMVIEPHVRINDESGTADDGGLFYVENLPPETLMVGLAQASVERFKKDSRKDGAEALLTAEEVLGLVFDDDSCRKAAKACRVACCRLAAMPRPAVAWSCFTPPAKEASTWHRHSTKNVRPWLGATLKPAPLTTQRATRTSPKVLRL